EAPDRLGLELAAVGGEPLAEAGDPHLVNPHATALAHETRGPPPLSRGKQPRARLPPGDQARDGPVRGRFLAPVRALGGRALGAICLLFADERALDRREQAHVAWCAEEAAQALDRARVHERDHTVAVSLQRSLLSQDLPAIP